MTSATLSANFTKTLLIVDPSVQDYRSLTEHLAIEADVLLLDAEQDGIEQISAALASRESIQSLHLLSHGSPGTLYLGTTQLSLATLSRYAEQIRQWVSAFTDRAEVLLYGCEVAAGQLGQRFIQNLNQLTGASIAASTNKTGSAALGGDWTLEATVGTILSPTLFCAAAMADFQSVLQVTFINETFTNLDVRRDTAFWSSGVGVDAGGAGNPPVAPFLTARPVTTADPLQNPNGTGGLPGNPADLGGNVDPDGFGVLRLTNNTFDQAGFVLYNQAFNSRAGVNITFDMFQYNGNSRGGAAEGGDGINFFLIDGSTPYSTQAGAFGGSLGYAQRNVGTPIPGVAGGYLGIGFDEFGNYSNSNEGRQGGDGFLPNTVSVRGRGNGQTGYQYLRGETIEEYSLYVDTTDREAARRQVNVTLSASGVLNVAIDANGNGNFTDPGEAVITNFNTRDPLINNGDVPATFKLGFAAGTGDSTAIHEIRNLVVTTLTSPPITSDITASLPANSVVQITGLAGTDPDGIPIQNFQILTLPSPAQGTLFLGDPRAGGIPIQQGQPLTLAQANTQVFFQSSGEFSGANFTYTALDNLGAQSLDDNIGLVSLNLISTQPPGPGLPDTLPRSFDLPQGTITNLTGLEGTAPPGDTITSFTIQTVPNRDQGTLFLGVPGAGGRPVTPGQVIPANQISNLYFQTSDNFNATGFSYTATDNQGQTDPTPATVSLNFIDLVGGVGCQEGITRRATRRNQRLVGTENRDTLIGNGSNNTLLGRDCPDILDGRRGNDRLRGGNQGDQLEGRQNNDELRGDNGNDRIGGGLGNDRAFGGRNGDRINGGFGNDRLNGDAGDDSVRGGRGRDNIRGGTNNDTLFGNQDNDVIRGDNGDDFIETGLGSDRAFGGRKADILLGRRGNDRMFGGSGSDLLVGERGNDRLVGSSQADNLRGGLGRDVMIGGLGRDVMNGGGGQDIFIYESARQGLDQILRFSNRDRIDLSRVFNRGSYSSDNRFQRYVRLSATRDGGTLMRVDSNGNEARGFVRLAVLQGIAPGDISANSFILS